MVFLRNTMLGADDASGEAGTPPFSFTGKCARKTAFFISVRVAVEDELAQPRRAWHGLGASFVAAL